MIKPLHNKVVIKPDEVEKETASGIIIPDSVQAEKPAKGTVVIGNSEVHGGDRVVFSKFGMDEVEDEGETFYVVSASCVLAILK